LKEGIRDGKGKIVKNVGDVMYDSILYYSKIAEIKSTILKDLGLLTPNSELPACPAGRRTPNYYLATLHRAENTDDPKRLKSILKALNEIGKEAPVILPLHPRTKKVMKIYNLSIDNHRVKLIEPVSYLNMLTLEKHARAILTDSGGVQKEAYWFKVPCFTLRDETEWVETVKSGWNVLVGAETERIIEGVHEAMRKVLPRKAPNAFGNGKACGKIVDFLIKIR
jgi:UDP-N-acetylglucosamine 2-epimerase